MDWLGSFRKAIDYMEERLLQDIGAKEVADAVHISPFYFQKCFKMVTGYSIGGAWARRPRGGKGHRPGVQIWVRYAGELHQGLRTVPRPVPHATSGPAPSVEGLSSINSRDFRKRRKQDGFYH